MTSVAGIDLSLASTGVARMDWPEDGAAPRPRTFRIQSTIAANATLAEQDDRMVDVVGRVALAAVDADLAVIEGPAMARSGAGGFPLWGLWWRTVAALRAAGTEVAVMSPSTLKVYAVGFGGSAKQKVSKADIRRAVAQRYPQFLTAGSHDVADAVVLCAAAARALDHPVDELPATHLRAMTSVRWPNPPGGNS